VQEYLVLKFFNLLAVKAGENGFYTTKGDESSLNFHFQPVFNM